jgi:outer membrane protein OmpA-like peptidoglycan-associated protein
MKTLLSSTLCFVLICCSHVIAQQSSPSDPTTNWKSKHQNRLLLGVIGGGSLNFHRGILTTKEGILECGQFENATTLGWLLGNSINIPITEQLSIAPTLYFHKANAGFSAGNPVQPRVSLGNGSTVPMNTDHTLNVSLDYLTLDVPLRYFINERLYAFVGGSIGFNIGTSFEQEENILSPTGLTFLDGSTTRKVFAGTFTDANGVSSSSALRFAGIVGVGYMLPVSQSIIVHPELSYQYALSPVLADNDWKVHALRGGIGISYVLESAPTIEPTKPEEIKPLPPPPAPVPAPAPAPPVAILDVYNTSSGKVQDFAEVSIVENRTIDVLPLLPYIFFEQSSSDLPEKYNRLISASTNEFKESSLGNEQLTVYYHLLNIIGVRMRKYPTSSITLIGCIESDDEWKTKSLAQKRTRSVADYLVNVWGIDKQRITLKQRTLPFYPSTQRIADGRNENRRVEIESDDKRVLAPVYVRSIQRTVQPDGLVIKPSVVYSGIINESSIELSDSRNNQLWSRNQQGSNPVEVSSTEAKLNTIKSSEPIQAKVTVTSDDKRTSTAVRSIPVRKSYTSSRGNSEIVKDTMIERYSMILFNFDRASTIETNNQIISMIRSRIRTSSSVAIEGMTDYIGRKRNNLRLSSSRANAVESSILQFIKPISVRSTGLGEVELFDNTTPEGRFYNRRVLIEIATPLDNGDDMEGEE